MKTDNIKNAKNYYNLGERFQKGFEYLQKVDLLNMENGKYEIDGKNLFVSIQDYTSKPFSEGKFEAHKKYADIQYIIKGKEKLGYTTSDVLTPVSDFDTENDIVFFQEKEPIEFVHAKEGDFVIFMPQDAHMPCIADNVPEYVKKAVVKVLL